MNPREIEELLVSGAVPPDVRRRVASWLASASPERLRHVRILHAAPGSVLVYDGKGVAAAHHQRKAANAASLADLLSGASLPPPRSPGEE